MACCPPSPIQVGGSCDSYLPFNDPKTADPCYRICPGMPICRVDNGVTFTELAKTPGEYTTAQIQTFASEFEGVALDSIECDACQITPQSLQLVKPDCEFRMKVTLDSSTEFNRGAYVTMAEDPDNAGQLSPDLYTITATLAEAIFQTAESSGAGGKTEVIVTALGA